MASSDDLIHGFKQTGEEFVAEVNAMCKMFVHEKTGAPVLVMCTDDDNKVFCTYFKTPPTDDTGLPHILEHSVLNGSRKYPVKEPFVELIKASLYTFLNAMTFDDKTVYPIASRNSQDFRNLMDVYLDAIYHPNLSKETFLQEGWHHQIDDSSADIEYSGVVYSEMQGATSSPESVLYDRLEKELLPDSTYGFNAGGDPESIPDLTYEQFVAFHNRYYHPSNSRTVLYGDFELEERLRHLAEYYDGFEFQSIDSSITPQPRFESPRTANASYPVDPGTDVARKTFVLRAWLMGFASDPVSRLSLNILSHILSGNSAAPLRRALVESMLGEDTVQWYNGESMEGYYAFGLKGTDTDQQETVETLIDETLARLVNDGLDPRTVAASINSLEFRLREANFAGYPKGLVYALTSAESWLYDEDPLMFLKYEAPLAAIKEKVAAGPYFEELIRELLIENRHRLTLVVSPDEDLGRRRNDAIREKLAEVKAGLDDTEIESLVVQCKELREAQLRPDSPEALARIPKLPLDCIDRTGEILPIMEVSSSPEFLFSELPTNGIGYARFVMGAEGLGADLIPYMPLFAQALTQVGTEKQDYVELIQEIGMSTGGIGASYGTEAHWRNPEDVRGHLSISGKAVNAQIPKMVELITDVLGSAKLTDVKRITEIARTAKARLQSSIAQNGSHYAISRVSACLTAGGKFKEMTSGICQYRFLEKLLERLNVDAEGVIDDLMRIKALVLTRCGLRIHLTGGSAELASLQSALPVLVAALPEGKALKADVEFGDFADKQAWVTPSKVQYVAKGARFHESPDAYRGHAMVLNRWLRSDYLWNTVRVQGNAYGCFSGFSLLSGLFYCCSYRDPQLSQTIDVYDQIAETLEGFKLSRDDLEKLIISTMGEVDSPHTASQKGGIAFNNYVAGVTNESIQRWREEILDCSIDDLKAYATQFRRFAADGKLCVVGGSEAVEKDRDLFDVVENVFTSSESPFRFDDPA